MLTEVSEVRTAGVIEPTLHSSEVAHGGRVGKIAGQGPDLSQERREVRVAWRGRGGFIDYLSEHGADESPWLSVVINELRGALKSNDLEEFNRWLDRESGLLGESHVVRLIELAAYTDRGPFIARLIELRPELRTARPALDSRERAERVGHRAGLGVHEQESGRSRRFSRTMAPTSTPIGAPTSRPASCTSAPSAGITKRPNS